MIKLNERKLRENLIYKPSKTNDKYSQRYNPFGEDYDNPFKKKKKGKYDDWVDTDYDKYDWGKIKKIDKEDPTIYREINEEEYIILTIERLKKEIGDNIEVVLDRIEHWVITCMNCGYKGVLSEFEDKLSLGCPKCNSKAIGIPEEKEHEFIKEILKGDDEEVSEE